MLSFNEWMSENCSPAAEMTFRQYGNYLMGWRNSMPWAYKGMSVAYDEWAESRWYELQLLGDKAKEWAMLAWKMGLQSNHERLMRGEQPLSAEDAADVVLSIPAVCLLAVQTLPNPEERT